jgi:hypothetical protein
MGSSRPLRCEICDNMTSGYSCKGYMLCIFCHKKYNHIPDFIAIGQWGKYVRIERRKTRKERMSLL